MCMTMCQFAFINDCFQHWKLQLWNPLLKRDKKIRSSKIQYDTNGGWSEILESTFIVGDESRYANANKFQWGVTVQLQNSKKLVMCHITEHAASDRDCRYWEETIESYRTADVDSAQLSSPTQEAQMPPAFHLCKKQKIKMSACASKYN